MAWRWSAAAALRVGVVVAAVAASACQLVLGFEDRLPFPSSAGGGGEGGSGGGPTGGAPSGFGDPEEVASGLGPIDAVAISGDDVYVLEQAFGAFQIQRLRGGSLEVVASGLPLARGLVAAGDEVLTTHGPLDQLDPQCHVSAFGRAGKRDVMRDFCDQDENKFFALAVEGDTLAASFLDIQGSDHSDVRTSSVSGSGAVGMLIGLGEAEDEGVPSIAIAGGTFFWVDSELDDVMTSSGELVQNLNNPPGEGVNTLAQGLSVATELAVTSGRVYVARADQLAVVDAGGNVSELAQAASPRGLAADASLLVWAEVDKVRAFTVEAEEISTIDDVDDEPTDVALGASFVVYVTTSGRIVRIPRQ